MQISQARKLHPGLARRKYDLDYQINRCDIAGKVMCVYAGFATDCLGLQIGVVSCRIWSQRSDVDFQAIVDRVTLIEAWPGMFGFGTNEMLVKSLL